MEVDVEYFIVVVGNSFGSSTARCQAKNDFKSLVQAQKQKGKVKKNKKTQNIEDELIVVISVDFQLLSPSVGLLPALAGSLSLALL